MGDLSVNQKILDLTIHHSAFDMMRVETSLKHEVLQELKKLEKNLIGELAAIDAGELKRTAFQKKRLNALLAQTSETISNTYKSIDVEQSKAMKLATKAEMLWVDKTFESALGAKVASVATSAELVEKIASGVVVEGKYPKQWWAKQKNDYTHAFETQIRQGMLRGETVGQLIKRVRDIQPTARRHAEAQVRTSFQAVAQAARTESYKVFDDVLKGYQYVATLDVRTTDICQASDGAVFDKSMAIVKGPAWVHPPPQHWNCRSTIVPITLSWEELGAKGGEKYDDMPPSTRASMDGQIPKTISYTDWLKGKADSFQDMILGPTKGKLFREGKIQHLSQLLDQSGNPLTIKELLESLEHTDIEKLGTDALLSQIKDKNTLVTFHKTDTFANNIYQSVPEGKLKLGPPDPVPEPDFVGKAGKKKSSGVIIIEPDTGKVWVFEPKDHFGGYQAAFPKGQIQEGLSAAQSAIKEVWEETGLQAKIIGHLGDYEKTTSVTRYYIGVRTGGTPTTYGWEAQSVKLVPRNQLGQVFNVAVEKKIAKDMDELVSLALKEGKGDLEAGMKIVQSNPLFKEEAIAKKQLKAVMASQDKTPVVNSALELMDNEVFNLQTTKQVSWIQKQKIYNKHLANLEKAAVDHKAILEAVENSTALKGVPGYTSFESKAFMDTIANVDVVDEQAIKAYYLKKKSIQASSSQKIKKWKGKLQQHEYDEVEALWNSKFGDQLPWSKTDNLQKATFLNDNAKDVKETVKILHDKMAEMAKYDAKTAEFVQKHFADPVFKNSKSAEEKFWILKDEFEVFKWKKTFDNHPGAANYLKNNNTLEQITNLTKMDPKDQAQFLADNYNAFEANKIKVDTMIKKIQDVDASQLNLIHLKDLDAKAAWKALENEMDVAVILQEMKELEGGVKFLHNKLPLNLVDELPAVKLKKVEALWDDFHIAQSKAAKEADTLTGKVNKAKAADPKSSPGSAAASHEEAPFFKTLDNDPSLYFGDDVVKAKELLLYGSDYDVSTPEGALEFLEDTKHYLQKYWHAKINGKVPPANAVEAFELLHETGQAAFMQDVEATLLEMLTAPLEPKITLEALLSGPIKSTNIDKQKFFQMFGTSADKTFDEDVKNMASALQTYLKGYVDAKKKGQVSSALGDKAFTVLTDEAKAVVKAEIQAYSSMGPEAKKAAAFLDNLGDTIDHSKLTYDGAFTWRGNVYDLNMKEEWDLFIGDYTELMTKYKEAFIKDLPLPKGAYEDGFLLLDKEKGKSWVTQLNKAMNEADAAKISEELKYMDVVHNVGPHVDEGVWKTALANMDEYDIPQTIDEIEEHLANYVVSMIDQGGKGTVKSTISQSAFDILDPKAKEATKKFIQNEVKAKAQQTTAAAKADPFKAEKYADKVLGSNPTEFQQYIDLSKFTAEFEDYWNSGGSIKDMATALQEDLYNFISIAKAGGTVTDNLLPAFKVLTDDAQDIIKLHITDTNSTASVPGFIRPAKKVVAEALDELDVVDVVLDIGNHVDEAKFVSVYSKGKLHDEAFLDMVKKDLGDYVAAKKVDEFPTSKMQAAYEALTDEAQTAIDKQIAKLTGKVVEEVGGGAANLKNFQAEIVENYATFLDYDKIVQKPFKLHGKTYHLTNPDSHEELLAKLEGYIQSYQKKFLAGTLDEISVKEGIGHKAALDALMPESKKAFIKQLNAVRGQIKIAEQAAVKKVAPAAAKAVDELGDATNKVLADIGQHFDINKYSGSFSGKSYNVLDDAGYKSFKDDLAEALKNYVEAKKGGFQPLPNAQEAFNLLTNEVQAKIEAEIIQTAGKVKTIASGLVDELGVTVKQLEAIAEDLDFNKLPGGTPFAKFYDIAETGTGTYIKDGALQELVDDLAVYMKEFKDAKAAGKLIGIEAGQVPEILLQGNPQVAANFNDVVQKAAKAWDASQKGQAVKAAGEVAESVAETMTIKVPQSKVIKNHKAHLQDLVSKMLDTDEDYVSLAGKQYKLFGEGADPNEFHKKHKALLTHYKKSVYTGKTPTKAQYEAFGLLDDVAQEAFNAEVQASGLVNLESTVGTTTAPTMPVKTLPTAKTLEGSKFQKYSGQLGSNTGGFYQSVENSADRWYFKFPGSDDIARNEVLAGKLYEFMGVEVPELHLVTKDGQIGVASRIVDGVKQNKTKITAGKISGVNDNMVVDAFMGNWDVTGATFDNLLVKGNRAVRIDVGGSLRYRAQGGQKSASAWNSVVDELETLRDRSRNANTASAFKTVTQEDLEAGARKVLALTDDDITQMVNEFGPTDWRARRDLVETLKARRDYIGDKFPKARTPLTKASVDDIPEVGKKVRATDAEIGEIHASRSNGFSIRTDVDEIEDQSVLVWKEQVVASGKTVDHTGAVFKIRGDKLKELSADLARSNPKSAAPVNTFTTQDTADDILTAMRGIAMQSRKGEALRATDIERAHKAISSYKSVLAEAKVLKKKGRLLKADVDLIESTYSPWVKKMEKAVAKGQGKVYTMAGEDASEYIHGNVQKLSPIKLQEAKKTAKKVVEEEKLVWRKSDYYEQKSQIKGHLTTRPEQQASSQWPFKHYYEADYEGARIRFWPEAREFDYIANHGKIEILMPGDATKAQVNKIYDIMEKLGINTTRPSPAQQEELYLIQLIRGQNKPDTFRTVIADIKGMDTAEERVKYLKAGYNGMMKAKAKKAGFKNMTDSPLYNPAGKRHAFNHGTALRERPDLIGREWDEFADKYLLHHDLHSGNVPNSVDKILNSGGSLVSTYDRLRKGVPWGGMSPEADMKSGGAHYVFTRIKQKFSGRGQIGITWKAKTLRRADAISYPRDEYGNISESILSTRKTDVAGFQRAANVSNNETIFKHNLSILEDLDGFSCPAHQKDELLAVLRKHFPDGIWPDGRTFDELINLI